MVTSKNQTSSLVSAVLYPPVSPDVSLVGLLTRESLASHSLLTTTSSQVDREFALETSTTAEEPIPEPVDGISSSASPDLSSIDLGPFHSFPDAEHYEQEHELVAKGPIQERTSDISPTDSPVASLVEVCPTQDPPDSNSFLTAPTFQDGQESDPEFSEVTEELMQATTHPISMLSVSPAAPLVGRDLTRESPASHSLPTTISSQDERNFVLEPSTAAEVPIPKRMDDVPPPPASPASSLDAVCLSQDPLDPNPLPKPSFSGTSDVQLRDLALRQATEIIRGELGGALTLHTYTAVYA